MARTVASMSMSESQTSLEGLQVAAFESRRAEEMARLIERFGGAAHVSPSMREVPLRDISAATDFAKQLVTGQIDIVIFMTGTGFRHLLSAVEQRVDRQRFLNALADSTTIVRGPKPAVAMREVGISPTHTVPEPNTWREVLATVDEHLSVANQRVGLQEYGRPNASLIAGLEARGGEVVNLRVYHWDLPLDTGPLEENVRRLARGELDVVMFTTAHQAVNLFSFASRLGLADSVREGLRRAVVASIGPTTSEMLHDCGIPVDMEPSRPIMGHLVSVPAVCSTAKGMPPRSCPSRLPMWSKGKHPGMTVVSCEPVDASRAIRHRSG